MATSKSAAPKTAAAKSVKKVEKDPEVQIENALGRTELWFEKNWKILAVVVAAVLIGAGIAYAYEGLYKIPRGKKAADAMFVAQQLFAAEDFSGALEGDGNNLGMLDVVSMYGGTPEARLAAHYAGICYMQQGDLESAMEYLSKYRAVRGIPGALVNAQNEGLKGDIHVQRVDYPAAEKSFRKAVAASDNSMTAPMYLKKLGLVLEAMDDYAGAVEAYERIRDEYPASFEARDIANYIGAAKQNL